MDCPGCGRPVDPDDQFCKHCGARLGANASAPRSAAVRDMVAEYRQHLADKPDDPNSLYNLGLACLYSGQYQEAAEAFEAVVRLDPGEAPAHEKLAVALVRLNRREEALAHAREAHRLAPKRKSATRLLETLEG
jgi:tetratricopeptide (TPR) repeat protein